MGNINRFANAFTQLTDTPSAFTGAANQFVRVNGTPDALEFFDLLNTANTWSAVQTHTANISMAANIIPTTDNSRDLGSDALSFAEVWGRKGVFVAQSGAGTINPGTATGGIVAGRSGGPGTTELNLSGTYPPVAVLGNAFTTGAAQTARLNHQAGGGVMFGSAFVTGNNVAKVALIESTLTAYGCFVGGYAFCYGNTATNAATVRAQGPGSFVWGYAAPTGGGAHTIESQSGAQGAFVSGRTTGSGDHILRAQAAGSFVQGFLSGANGGFINTTNAGAGAFVQGQSLGGIIRGGGAGAFSQGNAGASGSTIRATGDGALAHGSLSGAGTIDATADGATALGVASTGTVEATGLGAMAVGSAGTGTISAGAANAFQFGVGSNTLADSFQVGNAGLRLKGTTGAPGTPQNGDIWVAGGFVYIRSNGVSVQIT